MSAARSSFLLLVLCAYGLFFSMQENRFAQRIEQLAPPLPPLIQRVALGYLRQLGGEMQFIKASVFYGGVKPGRDPLEYAEPLAVHFTAAATLHPHFVDTYFLCQATLPYINPEYTMRANDILDMGMQALPDNFVLPFFAGFNHFYHLKQPQEAAHLLKRASELPNGPSWLAHLASVLRGEGGDIYGGLLWLKAMLAAEEDEVMRERYRHSISMFERAVTVQQAIDAFKKQRGDYPQELGELVPAFLPVLPDFEPPFQLRWESPTLRLLRESKKNEG